jgi:hypothetical protein
MTSARKKAMRFVLAAGMLGLAALAVGPATAQDAARVALPPGKLSVLWSEQQCKDALDRAVATNTVAAYDDFINRYANCETQVAEAKRKRAALVTGPARKITIPPPVVVRPSPPSPTAPRSTTGQTPPPAPLPAPVEAAPPPPPPNTGDLQTRTFRMEKAPTEILPVFTDIGPTQLRIAANGGSAVILFTTASAAQTRNRKVCDAVMKLFDSATIPEVEAGMRRNPTTGVIELLRPVYWLLVQDSVPANKQKDCATRLTLYNYVRANTIRDKLRLYGPGPYFVVMRENETQAGVMDLSRVRPDDMERMTLVFRSGFSQRDDIWDQTSYTAENRRRTLQSALGGIFPDEFVNAIGLVVDPFRNRGPVCTLGDLADRGCARSAATRR